MRKFIFATTAAIAVTLLAPVSAIASTPQQDVKTFQKYFLDHHPGVPLADYINGRYAFNKDLRSQWENIEEFPLYEDDVAAGEKLFNTPFANGKTYAQCLKGGGVGTRTMYPYFDKDRGEIVTLEGEINRCRTENGEKPYKWKKGKIAQLTGYIAYTSRGKKFNTQVPNDPRALAMYERGKRHFYMKRGQLNLACADCHQYNAGKMMRSELLGPALGDLSHFPVYRKKWNSLGTPHRRFGGCNKQARAKPFKAQSDEYKALEYFLTVMMQGLEANGPSTRN